VFHHVSGQAVPGVEDIAGVSGDEAEVEVVMVDQQDHRVGGGQLFGAQLDQRHPGVDVTFAHVGVHGPHLGSMANRRSATTSDGDSRASLVLRL
jgi:hypothetical protein